MAKSKIKAQARKARKKVELTIKAIEFLSNQVQPIAEKGKERAQLKLAVALTDPTFTQKHESELVSEIGVKRVQSGKEVGYQVYAPVSGDNEIKYEMYFAEYGAGLGAQEAEHKPGAVKLNYTPTKVSSSGYWTYRLVHPVIRVDTLGRRRKRNYRVTNTSKAVNYMWSARKLMSAELKLAVANCESKMGFKFKTKTSIKRPRG